MSTLDTAIESIHNHLWKEVMVKTVLGQVYKGTLIKYDRATNTLVLERNNVSGTDKYITLFLDYVVVIE